MHDISTDLTAVSEIDAMPTILEVVCRITGLGFAAVARVTADRWVACAVRDEIEYGVVDGGELIVETTICNEQRLTGERIAIDHVAQDPRFARLRALGGSLELRARAGTGTDLIARAPLAAAVH